VKLKLDGRKFTLDGQPVPDIYVFIEENLSIAERKQIEALGVGDEMKLGGGAAATFTLRRIK
jgi:hypothetical protein